MSFVSTSIAHGCDKQVLEEIPKSPHRSIAIKIKVVSYVQVVWMNGLPHWSVLSPVLFNVYMNDQPIHNKTHSFIHADDLRITTQHSTFEKTETILTEALHNLSENYKKNHLRANLDKTQTWDFHLKNREASRKFNITFDNKHLEHISNAVFRGVTLDRTLSYKKHIHKLKC